MTLVVSLVALVLVAALVGRTCARARPGRPRPTAPPARSVELPDVVTGRGEHRPGA